MERQRYVTWQDGAMVKIITERLRLRLFQADDLPAFVAYRGVPKVARYQSWNTTYSMADPEHFHASQEGVEFGRRGAWVQLAAIDRLSGTMCGDCAVRVGADQPGPRRSASRPRRIVKAPDSRPRRLRL